MKWSFGLRRHLGAKGARLLGRAQAHSEAARSQEYPIHAANWGANCARPLKDGNVTFHYLSYAAWRSVKYL